MAESLTCAAPHMHPSHHTFRAICLPLTATRLTATRLTATLLTATLLTATLLTAVGLCGGARVASADAIVRSRAMLAGTIAEYHIEPGRVRVDLEISAADLRGFPNLLPDDLREELGLSARPLAERLAEFVERDLTIQADGGSNAPGRVIEIAPGERVRRDEITGLPAARGPDEEPEIAVFARLEYTVPERPRTLTFHSPRSDRPLAVGFVAYHQGVAVNDFRYLTPSQTVTLDWDDPWYSTFEARGLRRQYFAPMSAFLYVEPYEVRKEIIARPLDLQRWVDLGLEGQSVLPAARRAEVARTIGEFLRDRQPVVIDGKTPTPELARVNFLERTLRTSRVVEPGVDIDLYSAVVGAIYVYPTAGFPNEVTLEWDLWDDRITQIPASSVDQAGPLPAVLAPDYPTLVWNNFLTNPQIPSLEVVAEPPPWLARRLGDWVGVFSMALGGLGILAIVRVMRIPRWGVVVLLAATAVASWATWETWMSEEKAVGIVTPLLANIYHAFDYRNEDRIYDTLAASTDGPVLESTYLETRKGLELQSQGGARAKVKSIELVELEFSRAVDDGFRVRAVWNVAGAVGHWGHIHERRNQYEAWLGIAPRDGAWKLIDLDLVREERQ